jgi:hypothetical protein
MRNTIKSLVAVGALALAASAGAASAAVIYDNGPLSAATDGFTINFGYAIEDSFTVATNTTATGADFVSWDIPGDSLQSVDWVIEPTQTYGITGTATVTSTFLFTNGYGYDIYSNHISFAGVALTAGTYYFGLQNGNVGNGDPVYWDQNDGPSAAYGSGFGGDLSVAGPAQSLPCSGACTYSETFDITSGGVPEPTTWALMLIGFGGMGAALRSRRRVVAATA